MLDVESLPDTLYEDLEEHLATLEYGLLSLERSPADAELVDTLFRAAHSIKGASATFGLTEVSALTHLVENVLDELRAGALAYDPGVAGVLLRALDALRELVGVSRLGGGAPAHEGLRDELARLAPHRAASSPRANDGFVLFDDPPTAAPEPAPDTRAPPSTAAQLATIRVATEKVDGLLDLVGELIISHSFIRDTLRASRTAGDARLADAMAAMDRNTRELQERVMAIRMVPLSAVFRRLPRTARDLAAGLDKRVALIIEGEGTEIDKGMVEQLADPLLHLVRNAIDHGLESPSERRAAGKPEQGTVTVRAFREGQGVVIEVHDDGRGLDVDAIRTKASELGLVSRDAALSEATTFDLIFLPGFSTAGSVTSLSGRGVGMDVVKRNVEALNGTLTLASERGRGTRFTLKLPLTLSILDGLEVRVGAQTFILPLLATVESFRPKAFQLKNLPGRSVGGSPRQVLDVRDAAIPVARLHEIFAVPGAVTDPCAGIVCVLASDDARLAVLVDDIAGQVQVVVKTLDASFGAVDGIMGATILGNGRVSMIVDVQALFRAARGDALRGRLPSNPREEISCPPQ